MVGANEGISPCPPFKESKSQSNLGLSSSKVFLQNYLKQPLLINQCSISFITKHKSEYYVLRNLYTHSIVSRIKNHKKMP